MRYNAKSRGGAYNNDVIGRNEKCYRKHPKELEE
jgi:hypothetical protein